jgi:hypothetical protein
LCYNCNAWIFAFESRNEPRLARPGGIGYSIKAERQAKPSTRRRKSEIVRSEANEEAEWQAIYDDEIAVLQEKIKEIEEESHCFIAYGFTARL